MLEPIDSETRLCTLGLDREARLTISVMAEFPPEGAVLVTMPLVTTDVLTVPKERNVRLLGPAEAVPSEESNDSGMEVPKELAVTKLTTFSEELRRVANELASETLRLAVFGERAEDCIRLLGTDTALTIELGNSVLEISAGDEEMIGEDKASVEKNDSDNNGPELVNEFVCAVGDDAKVEEILTTDNPVGMEIVDKEVRDRIEIRGEDTRLKLPCEILVGIDKVRNVV